jgi:hypothetical protein
LSGTIRVWPATILLLGGMLLAALSCASDMPCFAATFSGLSLRFTV